MLQIGFDSPDQALDLLDRDLTIAPALAYGRLLRDCLDLRCLRGILLECDSAVLAVALVTTCSLWPIRSRSDAKNLTANWSAHLAGTKLAAIVFDFLSSNTKIGKLFSSAAPVASLSSLYLPQPAPFIEP